MGGLIHFLPVPGIGLIHFLPVPGIGLGIGVLQMGRMIGEMYRYPVPGIGTVPGIGIGTVPCYRYRVLVWCTADCSSSVGHSGMLHGSSIHVLEGLLSHCCSRGSRALCDVFLHFIRVS